MDYGYTHFAGQSRRRMDARAGFSLIEALVVLVILAVGILALVRLFPGGFLTIQRTGEQTVAQALSAQQLETQKSQFSLADSIIGAIPDTNNNLIIDDTILNIRPDDLTDYTATTLPPGVPPGTDPYFVSNVNRIRAVLGEAFRIPVASPGTGRGLGAIYMLKQGPVYNRFGSSLDDPNSPPDSVSVYGAALERVTQSSVATPDVPDVTPILRHEGQYAIDYDNPAGPRIAFFPRIADPGSSRPAFRQFRITYDYYTVGTGGSGIALRSIISGPSSLFVVPDVPAQDAAGNPPQPQWVPLFDTGLPLPAGYKNLTPPSGILSLKRDSEDVSRRFRLVSLTPVLSGGTPPFTDDPYEYAWYSPQEPAGVANAQANVGVLLFNPRGYDEARRTSQGTQPFTARIDYTIFDNHILREDRTLTGSGPQIVRLSVPFVLTTGDLLDDNSAYNGIFRAFDDQFSGINTPDVLIYDPNTGEEVARQTADANGIPQRTGAPFTLDARAGTITFNANILGSRPNRTLRIFYRAQKEWGTQLQKAHSHYVQASSLLEVTYRSYYIGGSQPGVGSASRIYFPICEAGKTVILGECWRQGDTSPVRNTAHKINDNPALFETLTETVNGQSRTLQMTWIDIGRPLSSEVTGRAVSGVRGGSLLSRVVWRDGSRWRKLDNETLLTPRDDR